MKFRFIFFGLLTFFLCFNIKGQQVLNWKFRHPLKNQWVQAGTYGSVQERLIAIGELPDPYYGMNETLFRWVEKYSWEFFSEFTVSADELQNEFIMLNFPGIDTYAEIFLNGDRLGFAENAFRPYTFEVKKKLTRGRNELRVVFYPPVFYHKEAYLKSKYKLPAPNDVDSIAIAPYTRKPQYQFGWDWALRMTTLGFLKPVELISYNENKILSTCITTDSLSEGKAYLSFQLHLLHPAVRPMIWKSELFGNIAIAEGERVISRTEIVDSPRLWWPRGQGKQERYSDTWELSSNDRVLEKKHLTFGIRKTTLLTEPDQWGTSYVIKVNDREIFCKGGDYIPQDIFPTRVKDSDIRKLLLQMVQSNYNMVRVWGGGYYPDDVFYEICDSLGLMVWQDFMFACAMYPGDPDFLENVKRELVYQIPRIASHPSLTLFNGNNEVDVAWKYWGFQLKHQLFGANAKEIEASYERLFKQLIPNTLTYYTNVPYIHTSPLSHWGKDDYYNHGSQHYWGVWHGKDPMSDFGKKIGRFNAEYGFQSFPEYATLLAFSTKKEWNLNAPVMKHHQKSYVGNGMILKHAQQLFGEPSNFEDFVYYSQLTQATAVRMAVTGHRLDAPRCMGTLYWQVNDCWPAPTWSSIDYFGNWKALQYWVKDDYEDVAVLSTKQENGDEYYYLISDQPDTFQVEINYTVFNLKGKPLKKEVLKKQISGNHKELLFKITNDKNSKNPNTFVQFSWNDAQGKLHYRTFSHLPKSIPKVDSSDVKLLLTDVDTHSKQATIILTNASYIRNVWIYSMIRGVNFNQNFCDLLPGTHRFRITFESLPSLADFGVKWM
jgi:beta-mannosidase